jgi:uncharacterized sulfatase
MNRRVFLKTCGLAAAAWAQPAGRRPNFIVILADDLGYGDLACYGSKTNETPHLDLMAAEGVRFTSAYVPMPFCAPTRSALLTGRYPFRTTVTGNPAPDGGVNEIALPQTEVTIAEALKPLGYATMAIGKWHLGHVREALPRTQGFDEYYGILYSNDMRPVQIVHNERVAQYPVVQSNLTRDYTSRALEFIERHKNRPFFLYLPHAMPHKPLAASEEFYRAGKGTLYADVLRELDWSVGQILAKVRELGLDSNTLVVFTSDNGPWFGGSTSGLRGMKGSNWEGGIRVPMIARWPGRVAAGNVSSEMCGVIDLLPTICKLAGVPPPTDRVIDGKDISELLTKPGARTPHEALYSMSGARLHTVRSGKWKLHVRPPAPGFAYQEDASQWVDPRGPDGVTLIAQHEQARPNMYPGVRTGEAPKAMMLFDLDADPAEQKNVAAQHTDVVARLQALFEKMEAQVPPPHPAPPARGRRGLMRLKGGELRYDVEPTPR